MSMALYGADLSYIHAQGFGWYALQSAPGLLALLRRNGVTQGLVVDLGCGNGIWPQRLAWAGYQALGIDASPDMIRLARRQVPDARFEVADLRSARLPRCEAVTSLGEALSYATRTAADMHRLIARVYRALRPGGLFVFDIAVRGRDPGGMPRSGHWLGEDWAAMVKTEEDASACTLTRRLTSFRKVGAHYRRSEEVHTLRLYSPAELQSDLKSAGFAVTRLRGFGRVRFQSGHAGFLARKS
jgi:SAM-dependent methyltransferase